MLQILDFEHGLAMADTLAEAADRLRAGEGVSGPASGRHIGAIAEFAHRYAGGHINRRDLNALKLNPRLQIHEDPRALLTCNYDPFKALCHPDRATADYGVPTTPGHDRCEPGCANISRTDTTSPAPNTKSHCSTPRSPTASPPCRSPAG